MILVVLDNQNTKNEVTKICNEPGIYSNIFSGSDVDTRRRAACDLVKGLSRFFEPQITSIFGGYVKTMLDMYNANPAQAWKKKDAAIYLVTSLATKVRIT